MKKRIIVVGAGLSGAVVSRRLAETGHSVEIIEQRNHVGGNLYDCIDKHGIKIHLFGPHIFHTNSERVWKYVSLFEEWDEFKLICGAVWDGKFTPTAFNFKTIDIFYDTHTAARIKNKIGEKYRGRDSASVVELLNDSDVDIRGFAEFLFKNDYAPYTAKQWGVKAEEIDPSVLERVPIRFSYEEGYFKDKYQALPRHSYMRMFENILDHPNIKVVLGEDALREKIKVNREMQKVDIKGEEQGENIVVYTGTLDKLFDLKYGKLPYRSLCFEWKYEDIESFQEAPVVAYPKAEKYTRITEYKKLPLQDVRGTSYAVEYPLPYRPGEVNEPYYPVLTVESQKIYRLYEKEAKKIKNLYFCGRLADFKYYNMDQVIESALVLSDKILKEIGGE